MKKSIEKFRKKAQNFKEKYLYKGKSKKGGEPGPPKHKSVEKIEPAETIYPIRVKRHVDANGFTTLEIEGVSYKTKLTKKFENRKIWTQQKLNEVITPLTGKVKKVRAVNDNVTKGEWLIIIDSMKMNNKLLAEENVIIKEVLVAEGDHVKRGDILLLIE